MDRAPTVEKRNCSLGKDLKMKSELNLVFDISLNYLKILRVIATLRGEALLFS